MINEEVDRIFCFIVVKKYESCLYGFETRAKAQAGMRFARNRMANTQWDSKYHPHPLVAKFNASAFTEMNELVARKLVDNEFGENELVIGFLTHLE